MKPLSSKHKKIGIWFLAILVIYTILGFGILPPLVKHYALKKLSQVLHREVSIGKIKLNPYTYAITINNFQIQELKSQRKFIAFDELYLNFQLSSLFRGGYVFHEIRLKKPYINIVRNQDLTYNFSDLLPAKSTPPLNEKPKKIRFSLNNIQISDGIIDFADTPKKTNHRIEQLNLNVPFISNLPAKETIFVQPSFSAIINNALVTSAGKTKPFSSSRETEFTFNFKNIDIPYYLAYIPIKMEYKLASGYANFSTSFSFINTTKDSPSLIVRGLITLQNLEIQDLKSNPMLIFPLIRVDINTGDVFRNQWHLNEFTVSLATVNVIRNRNGNYNLEVLKPKSEKKSESGSAQINIDSFRIEQARIAFQDFKPANPFQTVIESFDLTAENISTASSSSARYLCSLTTKEKEEVTAAGTLIIEPFASQGTFAFNRIPVKKYTPYYQTEILFQVKDGTCQVAGNYNVTQEPTKPIQQFSAVTITISNLKLTKDIGQPDFVIIPNFTAKDIAVDVLNKTILAKEIASSKGKLVVERYPSGRFSFDSLFQTTNPEPTIPVPSQPTNLERQWRAKIERINLDKYTINWIDQTLARAAEINLTDLKLNIANLSNVSSDGRARLNLSCQFDKKGSFNTSGWLTLTPVMLQSDLALQKLEVFLLQPYIEDRIKILITSGYASITGAITYRTNQNGTPVITYTGQAQLAEFVSKEKLTGEDFLKWNSFEVNGIEFASDPFTVHIRDIGLTDVYTNVVINADSTINLSDIFVSNDTTQIVTVSTTKPAEPPTSKLIKIDRITLNQGKINFVDKSISPAYTTQFSDITCQIIGLTSESTTAGDIMLTGRIDNTAPIQIIGKINPLREELYIDLKLAMKNFDMNALTPFSSKYVGYTIEKGKLFLDISCLIDKRKLDSKNTVFLDQFDFGNKVDSPDALKLPVKLGVALLKDLNGEIHLDIPVSGNLDDPKFRIGTIILKIIINIFTKALTSPFSLLGAILGGNAEEFSYLEFAPAHYQITEANIQKLDKLVDALVKRPALQLEITGYVDVNQDREALRELMFSRKLKSLKLQELIKKGEPDRPVDEVVIDPKEYERYLTIVYKKEKFPKEKNIIGLTKTLPVPEMEQLIRQNIIITDDDLKLLAANRAKSVQQYIIATNKVKPERIFLTEPKQLEPEKKEKLSNSRVEFKLQ
ncbi:MAG: DUF748 domain-containing protein [bacterium]|nr:DUF748 domain-containing protein [bacterium]